MTKTFSDLIVGGLAKQALDDMYAQLTPEALEFLQSHYAQPGFKRRLRGAVRSGAELLGKGRDIFQTVGSYAARNPGYGGQLYGGPSPGRFLTRVPAGVMEIDPSQLSLANALQSTLMGSVAGRLPNA